MSDHITAFLEAIEQGDPQAMRSVYAPGARLITMTPNTFNTDEGVDAIAARLEDWFLSWEEQPGFSFLSTIRDGDRAFVEFERTSTFEGAQWVVRQAHVMDVAPDGIREHRVYCCGPRQGAPDLAAAYGGAR
jgi:ketosteroid isomerase-like protein